jgi:hypothetical protein
MKKGKKVISVNYLKNNSIEMTRVEKIKSLLEDLRENAINEGHRHEVINLDCPECKFRLVEAGLQWWLELEVWDEKFDEE